MQAYAEYSAKLDYAGAGPTNVIVINAHAAQPLREMPAAGGIGLVGKGDVMLHKIPGRKDPSDFTFNSTFTTYQLLASDISDEHKLSALAVEVASTQDDALLMRELDLSSSEIAAAKIRWLAIQEENEDEEKEHFG